MTVSIWYVSKYVAPPIGTGAGARGYELMRELAIRGNDCTVITSDSNHLATVPDLESSQLSEDRDGMRVLWLKTLKAHRPRSPARALSWLHFEWRLVRMRTAKLSRPDVIVVSSLSLLTLVTGVVLARRHRCRLVVEIRDIWPLTLVDEAGLHPRHPVVFLLGLIERFGYRHADAIVGTMPNLGEHVAEVLGEPRETHCIPQGYAPRTVTSPAPRSTVQDRQSRDAAFVIGYAGTIGVANALDTFFDAAHSMAADTSVSFVVLGDGPLLGDYKARFAGLPNITFVPKVAKEGVNSVLAECDVLYLGTRASQRYRFGQSLNKVIDYMLAGKPIVASYSGYRSMIDEARCGTFIPAQDTPALVREIRRLASLPRTDIEEIGRRGREWVIANRSFATLAAEYESVLIPAVHDPRRGPRT